MNICLSYGSRGEIVNASRSLAIDAIQGKVDAMNIDEHDFRARLLTHHCCDPDLLIRTSGEIRVSNFLLWQMAYSEMFFISKPWPAIEKKDLIEVIQAFALGRTRRYGR
jgi:undecaprenyl diphosphate synthase